jgi:hypothetical protein
MKIIGRKCYILKINIIFVSERTSIRQSDHVTNNLLSLLAVQKSSLNIHEIVEITMMHINGSDEGLRHMEKPEN